MSVAVRTSGHRHGSRAAFKENDRAACGRQKPRNGRHDSSYIGDGSGFTQFNCWLELHPGTRLPRFRVENFAKDELTFHF
jgi:hypothetical protein